MSITKLYNLQIEKFRALNNVEIEFGDYITVICGKNGTSKSSILGIAAQIFNFKKDYNKDERLSFQKIAGGLFKSQYSEHFRISEKFDVPGSMVVNIELFDGYTGKNATAKLELMKRGTKRGTLPRPVVRDNSTALGGGNTSRNFTHPVIFLSLKRLYPIADREYKVIDHEYLQDHKQEFVTLTNELLNRSSSQATGTGGTISSAVAHGQNYDQESVSVGEDNAGQIVLALMSFKKLKEEYPNYKGGLLLIDEADAGLFPTAQVNLLKMLGRECRNLNLQAIMTSHSPVLIEAAFERSQQPNSKCKTIYLSNTYGDVEVKKDWSWTQIHADITTQTIVATSGSSLPKINVYFEDEEAADFFTALMSRQPIKKFITPISKAPLGCSQYLSLIRSNIAEFSEKSIICLDPDAIPKTKGKHFKTIVFLPGSLPPDALIFEYLYNLPAAHDFWMNELQFTRDVFTLSASDVISKLKITGDTVELKKKIAVYQGNEKPRDIFKRFYTEAQFQQLISSGAKPYNPWGHWVKKNPMESNEFLNKFKTTLYGVMRNGYGVDVAKLTALEIKLKES